MKYALGSLLFAGALALSFGAARADVLVLTSSALKDNDQLAIKNACADKQRSPNCIGENISPPLAWSGAPERHEELRDSHARQNGRSRRQDQTARVAPSGRPPLHRLRRNRGLC